MGEKVDMRDTEYIWCTATVRMIIESANSEQMLLVNYQGWNRYFDEIISKSSPRIAPHGLYTSRKDIPKYQLKTENAMQGHIIN